MPTWGADPFRPLQTVLSASGHAAAERARTARSLCGSRQTQRSILSRPSTRPFLQFPPPRSSPWWAEELREWKPRHMRTPLRSMRGRPGPCVDSIRYALCSTRRQGSTLCSSSRVASSVRGSFAGLRRPHMWIRSARPSHFPSLLARTACGSVCVHKDRSRLRLSRLPYGEWSTCAVTHSTSHSTMHVPSTMARHQPTRSARCLRRY